MGLFDKVIASCPHCGTPNEFQSKAAKDGSMMRDFDLIDAPDEILIDIAGESTTCKNCKNSFVLAKISKTQLVPTLTTADLDRSED